MNRIGLVLGWFTAALVLGGSFGLVFLAPTAHVLVTPQRYRKNLQFLLVAITDDDIDFSQEGITLTIRVNNLGDDDIPLTWQYAQGIN